jgi:two-component system sensor histidine kinase CpxA
MALGILEQRADARQQTYAKSAGEKAAQIAALVNDLLAFSKASFAASAVQLQLVRVLDTAEEAVRRESVEGANIQLQIPSELTVSADSELLIRALANLLRNAIRHAGNNGPITISATKHTDEITISVADSGPGVPADELNKIFDAFYRLDAARTRETGGVGLGLTIVKTCIESCHGRVTARNRKPAGLEVLIHLPAATEPSASYSSQAPALQTHGSQ